MSSTDVWPSCGFVWTKKDFHARVSLARCIYPRLWLCEKLVYDPYIYIHHFTNLLDEISLDILRGLQGIGVAASIPASVRLGPPYILFTKLHFPVRNLGTLVSARKDTHHRICYICGRGASRCFHWCGRWGDFDPVIRVRIAFYFSPSRL